MKLELKENMYVRTKDGYINKIKKVNQFNVLVYGRDLFGEELNIPNNEITKASYNIIDILEKGDYVNGHLVKATYLNGVTKYIKLDNAYENGDGVRTYTEDIKSVITKEQFEQMAYKVGE